METLFQSLFISVLSLIMIAVTTVEGDYQIGWVFRMYSASPNNYLATDGVCCRDNCGPCAPVLRLCFRESGHSHTDTETCTLGSFLRNGVTVHVQDSTGSPVIPSLFTGSFQVYVRVAHDGSMPRMYDPCHPIIDNVYFEFTGVATNQMVIEQQTGDFNRSTIELSVNIICTQGYNGSDCNTFCEEINGTLTCREEETSATTTPPVVNPMSSETICTTEGTTDDASSSTTPGRDTDPTSIPQGTDPTSIPQDTDPTSIPQDNDGNDTSTSSQTSSTIPGGGSTTVSVGGLTNERSDNILAIAVGVGVGGAVFLCLLVGLVILLLCLVIRVKRNERKTAFYTVRRAEASSSANGGDKYVQRDGGDNTQENGHPTNVEDLYTTVNKKSKAPPLPPAYVPDAIEYQNLNSQQGHQGVVYANASTSEEQDPEESIYLRYADPTPSTPALNVSQDDHTASNPGKSIYLRYADPTPSTPTSHVNEDAVASDDNEGVRYSELRQE